MKSPDRPSNAVVVVVVGDVERPRNLPKSMRAVRLSVRLSGG